MVKTSTAPITLEQFMQWYDERGPFEMIEGEIVPVPSQIAPQITRSSRIAGRLFRAVADYVDAHTLGEVFIETPFVLTQDTNWVTGSRVPDVMFVTAARLARLAADVPDWEDKPLLLVPDWIAEIVSPTDRLSEVDRKIARYLDDGARLVWVIEPEGQTVTIHTPGSKQITRLGVEDTLSGGDVIPGLELPVAGLFE
ncbi:MAG: Uma2 family endonuclease [Anaerolineae bacterium]|nr:Uma2 family endonuclease [Anaerolineae bacterium]